MSRTKKTAAAISFLAMLVALWSAAEAQHLTKTPLIGFIPFSGDPTNPGPAVQAFRGRLRELGYEEGRSIMVEYRYPLGRLNQMPSLVEELIRLKVNVLVVGPQLAISAAKKITKTTPIVMISSIDPVAAGHIASLSRPGGNITGVSQLTRDLSSKRVELLKEVIPDMRRVAILWDSQGPGPKVAFKEYQAAGRLFNLEVKSLEISGPDPDLKGAFTIARSGRSNALIVVANPLVRFHEKRIIELASSERIPAMYETSGLVEAGGLLSYAASNDDMYRSAANYVDRILKGASPSDLPVEQPTKFELVINLNAAKQIGLSIPPNILARADRVIR